MRKKINWIGWILLVTPILWLVMEMTVCPPWTGCTLNGTMFFSGLAMFLIGAGSFLFRR